MGPARLGHAGALDDVTRDPAVRGPGTLFPGAVLGSFTLMASPEIKISVGDLDAGGKQLTFRLRAAWIRGILEDHEATAAGTDGVLDVRASRSGNDVVVHGTLEAQLEVPCARCLAPVPLTIHQTLSLLFVPGRAAPALAGPKTEESAGKYEARGRSKKKKRLEPEEYEMSAADADTLPYDGEIVVLDDVVRDELILETPIFPLCSEDCPGMSAAPGPSGEAEHQTSKNNSTNLSGDGTAGSNADVDPRLLPLLRLKTQRD